MIQVAMTHVATLVCDPARPVLTGAMLRQASEAFRKQDPPRWLAQNIAADIFFEPGPAIDAKAIADRVRAALDHAAVDVIVQKAQGRRKKLLLADMDFDHDWSRMS